jgi:hypothetical protein
MNLVGSLEQIVLYDSLVDVEGNRITRRRPGLG